MIQRNDRCAKGSEHPDAIGRVGGSNPSSPTKFKRTSLGASFFYSCKMYYCYILYSQKLDKYYIGSTANIEGRLQRHNTSGKGFTSTGKPWVIKYTEAYETKIEALQRELQLKKWKSRAEIEKLIREHSQSDSDDPKK